MLNVYKCLSENISQAVTLHGKFSINLCTNDGWCCRRTGDQAATNCQHESGKEGDPKVDILLGH